MKLVVALMNKFIVRLKNNVLLALINATTALCAQMDIV
jgi:hypothetical protein